MTRLNTEVKAVERRIEGRAIHYICPKCKKPIEFKKRAAGRSLCFRCGQGLDWNEADDLPSVWLRLQDAGEAEYWIERYESMNGTLYGIDPAKWLKERHKWPVTLYFAFPEKAVYGRFVRMASKENVIVKGGYSA